jgi:hypothetical protein
MTDRTERHPPERTNGIVGEGQKGMPKEAQL